MMQVRAVGAALVASGSSVTFMTLFFLSAFAQTILLTVLPVEAFRLVGSARLLSLVYLGVGICGFLGRLAIPSLARMLGRARLLGIGAAALWISCALLSVDELASFVLGLALNA